MFLAPRGPRLPLAPLSRPFLAETKTGPGGDFPMNTDGGGFSYCHTGTYGMFASIEPVKQLRGDAGERQPPNLTTSLAHGPGGIFASAGTVITSNE